MANLFNEQRILGVRQQVDGTTMFNGLPVLGVVDVGGTLFTDNRRALGVDVLAADAAIYNDQPVRGIVVIKDGRKLYNNQLVMPVKAINGSLASATYLPAVASSPALVMSTARLVQGFAGACIRVQRASDDAEQDIGFGAKYLDDAAAATFRGASTLGVKTWYDQLGLNDHAQATKANQPSLFADAVFGGAPALTWDSLNGLSAGNLANVSKLLQNAVGPTISSRDFTIFVVAAPHYSFNGHSYFSNAYNNNQQSLYTSSANVGLVGRAGSGVFNSGLIPKVADTNIMCWKANASGKSFRLNGVKQDIATAPSLTSSAGFVLGSGAGNGATFDARMDAFAYVVYLYLSDADCALVEAALAANFPAVTGQANKIVFDGDSRTQGMGDGRNPWVKQVVRGLTVPSYCTNMGVGGQTLSTMAGAVAARVVAQYDATRTKNILVMGGVGINDFNADRTAAQMQADYITYTSAARAAGFKIVSGTVPPSQSMLAARNTERTTYNTWLRANYAAYTDALVDLDANANLGTWNSTYYTDFAHSMPAGHSVWASLFLPAINAL